MGRLAIVLFLAGGGRPVLVKPVSPRPPEVVRRAGIKAAAADSFSLSVTPATVTFTAINPATTPIDAGSSTVSVSWQSHDSTYGNWSLTVQSSGASFINCPKVPVSAVMVSCTSVNMTPGGSGSCGPPFNLSTTAQTIASGIQDFITNKWAVTLNFSLADSWEYIAERSPLCSLSLSYVATIP